ncbi:hypothetical protein ACSSV1_003768 [Labrenzia sp. MBR-25]|nr:hypothetical protein [Roseibium aggregatum]
MSDRTAHIRRSGLPEGCQALSGFDVRLIELQGPACGRFTR